ncbi:MAG: glycosidase, partial [Flavobacteriaceae bacterium]|nr:glycosidase [Flavobacteriaceae bacterium]
MRTLLLVFLLCVFVSCSEKQAGSTVHSTKQNWAFPYFEKIDSLNPILKPEPGFIFEDPITSSIVHWEERNVLNPTAVVRDDRVLLFYRAQDSAGTSRIGMAVSEDGLRFTKAAAPVFYPDKDSMKVYEWNYKKDLAPQENSEDCYFCYFDGVEDPRIVEREDGRYFMTYTSYDGKTARLSIASSPDLQNWTKHGLVLGADKYKDTWSKAGAIVSQQKGNRIIAKKIQGKYWMYYGDTNLYMMTSPDMITWHP